MAMRLDLARLPTDPVLLQRGVRELALTRYTDDGRLEIDHNRAENTLRGVASAARTGCLKWTPILGPSA
jgi:hypothetical protein